ncbi:hypothetical protein HPB51_006301 [Rhipicephalus microplus]|uniref:Uncharacterized protein n=1 Tax=Rhipicephalus microplus TaxID=6941 RepID=A0A9J6EM76_RHIMP|nr:hypothetical protein HPB51_006301 [Rhipicephalus microplus]
MPDQRVPRTYMTGSSDDVGLPSGNASLIRKLHNYARSADQNKQRYVPPKHAGVVFRESSAGPSSQNPTAVGVERRGTALIDEQPNQRPALRNMAHNLTLDDDARCTLLKLSNDGGRGCAPNVEERPTQDEMTCGPSPTSCTNSTRREPLSSDAFPRAVLESSDGGVANIETNHDQEEDRCTSFVEDTTSDGRSALCCEPEVRPESAPKNLPALPFSVKPVLDLDRVVKQERDAVSTSCDSDAAGEGRQGELGNDNHFEPPSGPCAADPASGGNVVLNGSPDPASSAGIVSNESPERYSKVHIPNNCELPPSTPSDVHAKGGPRKRRTSSCDHVGNDAKSTRRSEHTHERSFYKGKASAAPASVSESDYGPDASGHEDNRAAIRRPLQYDPNDNGAPCRNAPNGTACQKSAQGAY